MFLNIAWLLKFVLIDRKSSIPNLVAPVLRYISENVEDTIVPSAVLLLTIHVRLDSLPNWFTREPLSVVGAPIGPSLNAFTLGLAVDPVSNVDLIVWELALAAQELGLVPFSLK